MTFWTWSEKKSGKIRASHHPSLVLLCGNNEDYMFAERFGWEWNKDDDNGL